MALDPNTWLTMNLAAVGVAIGYQLCGIACGITRTNRYRVVGIILMLAMIGLQFVGRTVTPADNRFWMVVGAQAFAFIVFITLSLIPHKTAVTVK